MTYDGKKVTCSIQHPNSLTYDLIHLGARDTISSSWLRRDPVPPGFIVTTEVFRCLRIIENYKHARDHFDREIRAGSGRSRRPRETSREHPETPASCRAQRSHDFRCPG